MMTPILEARGLVKRYGQTQALAGLDLVASPGRVVALLGPNGAGKTTFVRAVYYVGLSLLWAAAIFVVFGFLAVARFARR
jgi:ABC-type Mn2+/Zn2+ transport system ATPase subunit